MPVKVLLVTSEGCKPCSRVKRILNELQVDIPSLDVEVVDFASPSGSKLAMQNGILYPPAVFIEGKLFAKGMVNADQMVATIRSLSLDGEERRS